MGHSKELVLVYKGMPKVSLEERFSIVLTPQNYILRKEKLPIKQEYQSKKIVSSIFDSFIDNKDEYSFFVYKEDEDWIFIAYKQQEVIDLLEESGIPSSNVDEIFFAQQMVSSISKPISLGEQNALTVIDGIATVVPKSILPDETVYENELEDIHPKKSVPLSTSNSYIDIKTALIFSAIFFIFAIFFIMEGMRYTSSSKEASQKVEEILQHYPALESSYKRESILSKYTHIDQEQRAKREVIKKLSKLISQNIKIEQFELKQNSYTAVLSTPNTQLLNQIKRKVKSNGMQISNISTNKITIKGHL